jgi:hypothetical protein
VHDVDVVQRHLAGAQHHVDRVGLVDVGGDLLSVAEQVPRIARLRMRELRLVRARDDAHAAALRGAVAERDPRRDRRRVAEEVRVLAVLMPGDEAVVVRRLRQDQRSPHHDVVAEDLGDRGEHARMQRQVVRPAERVVRAVEVLQRSAVRVDEARVLRAHPLQLAGIEDGDRKGDAGVVKAHPKTFSIARTASSMSSTPFGGLMNENQISSRLIASERGHVPGARRRAKSGMASSSRA